MEGFLGGLLFGNVDEEGHLDNEDFDKEIQEGLQSFVKSKQVTDVLSLSLDGLEKEDEEEGKKEGEDERAKTNATALPKDETAVFKLNVEMVKNSKLAGILFSPRSSQVRFTNLFRSAEFSHEFAQTITVDGGIQQQQQLRRYRLRRYKVRRRKQAKAVVYVEDQRANFKRRGWGHAGAGIAGDTLVRAMLMSSSSGAISAIGFIPSGLGSGASSRYRILSQLRASAAAIKKQSGPGAGKRLGTRSLDLLFERYAATDDGSLSLERIAGELKLGFEDRQFHPVQTTCWEERIVLDEAEAERLVPSWEEARLTKMFVQVKNQPPPRPMMLASRPGTPFLGTGYGSFVPSRPSSGYATPAGPKPAPNLLKRPRCEATRVINEDLERGEWLDSIIFDDCVAPRALPSTRLLLNLNDPLLLVDVEEPSGPQGISLKDISRLTKMINKAKSKKGMNGPVPPGDPATNAATAPIKAINFGKCQSGDKFNLSNDKYYDSAGASGDATSGPSEAVSKATQQTLVKSQLAARIGLQHSVPALKLLTPFFRTAWTKADIRAWHRPSLLAGHIEPVWSFNSLSPGQSASASKSKTAAGTVVAQVIRNAKKLTLKDGSDYVLLEYSEEHPLLMMNVGMATFFHQMYRKTGPKDPIPPSINEAGYGSPKVLEPGDPSPFWMFGDVEPGKMMPAIQNNLFRAPVFEHLPQATDFLAIRCHQKGKTGSKLYLRPLPPKVLLSGQTFPTAQVFGPHSRKHNNVCRGRIQVFAYRLFAKDVAAIQSGIQPRLRISRILSAFPLFSEGSVRKWLKEYAESIRGGKDTGVWVRKPDAPVLGEDSLRALVTPEMVCIYEAMLAGQQRLDDAGCVMAVQPDDYVEDGPEDRLDEGAGEMQLAPWNLTANFANAIIGKSALQVRGPGEPSGGLGEAFSWVKMPTRMATKMDSTDEKKPSQRAPDQQSYKADIARIWQAQLAALSNPVPPADVEAVATETANATAAGTSLLDSASGVWKDIQRSLAEEDEGSVTSKATSRATSANQTTTTSAAQKPSGGRRLVVTRTKSEPNGEAILEMETLNDPFVIQAYLKERRAFDIKNRRRAQMAAAAAAKAAARPPKAPKPPKPVVQRSTAAAAPKAPKKAVHVRCGTCGAIGHMRTNRVCPLYAEYEASVGGREAVAAEIVRVEGSKLTISRQSLHSNKKAAPKAVKKVAPPPLTFGQQRALGEMSLLLQDILVILTGLQSSWPFRKPVSRKDYPHYFLLITKPLDLGTVKSRARKLTYRSPTSFLSDISLIRDNCVQFNGPDHPFSVMAGEIVGRAEELVAENRDKFEQWGAVLDTKDAVASEANAAMDVDEVNADNDVDGDGDGDGDEHGEIVDV